MSYTAEFTERHELLDNLSPQAANGTVGAHNTNWVFVGDHHRVVMVLTAGEPGGASTINVLLAEATTGAGAGAQNIAAKAITPLVAADAGETVFIELRTAELDVNNEYDWVRAEVAVAVDTYTYDLKLFGFIPRYPPVATGLIAEIIP